MTLHKISKVRRNFNNGSTTTIVAVCDVVVLFCCRRGDVAEGDEEDGTLLVFVGLTK